MDVALTTVQKLLWISLFGVGVGVDTMIARRTVAVGVGSVGI